MAERRAVALAADLRKDPLTASTSIVVPVWDVEKAANPAPVPLEMPLGSTPCPFCPEQMADPVTSAGEETARAGGGAPSRPWSAMALRNRWPNTTDPEAAEVVVLSDVHGAHLLDMALDDAETALRLVVERAEVQRRRGLYPLVFVNHGVNAGSSQPHPHGQVLGLSRPDPLATHEAPALTGGRCVLCEPVPAERVVARLEGVSIVMPDAPTVDYEQRVVLETHHLDTRHLDTRHLDSHGGAWPRALGAGIGVALRALWTVTGPVAYNLLFHLDRHPHVHVTPRSARHSGYELAGIAACYVDPSSATTRLAEAAALETTSGGVSRSDAA